MKRRFGILLAAGALLALGGCVYTPGYYARPGVVYDDGTAVYGPAPGYDYGYYAPGYYYGGPGCCYGGFWPWIGFSYYGGYYRGGYRHDGHGWHGAPHGGSRPSSGGHGGSGGR